MCTMVKLKQMSGGTDLKKRGKGVEQGKNDGGKNLRSKVTEKTDCTSDSDMSPKKKKGGCLLVSLKLLQQQPQQPTSLLLHLVPLNPLQFFFI